MLATGGILLGELGRFSSDTRDSIAGFLGV